MSGRGFKEPHRNNLPRRKRRVLTAPVDATLNRPEKMFSDPTTMPLILDQSQAYTLSSFSSVETNTTEPPSSLPASPISSSLQKSPAPSKSPTTHSTFQTPKRPLFPGHLDDSLVATPLSLPITLTNGHLQPTSANLPRRHRPLVAREHERDRRSTTEQTTLAALQSPNPSDVCGEVGGQRLRQNIADADKDLVTNSESRNIRRIQSMCFQRLTRVITLGFLSDGDDHIQIKVYDNLTTPLSSLIPCSSSSSSPSPTPALSSSSIPHAQLTLSINLSSYTDGTTSLTDHQIRQACTFIEEHVSIRELSLNNTRPNRMSVLILAPRMRPEEAISIGMSYLSGIQESHKDEGTKGDEGSDDHHDHTYSTVHQLLMAFHDGLESPILDVTKPDVRDSNDLEMDRPDTLEDIDVGSPRGLRLEWRGVLSFDGMQRLDRVWTPTRRCF